MRFFRLLLFTLVFSFSAAAVVAQQTKNHALYTVGMTTRAFVGGARRNWQDTGPRPLNTVIWYPAVSGAPLGSLPEDPKFFGNPAFGKFFVQIPVAFNAPLLIGTQKRPLILLSHGSSGIGLEFLWLGTYLASHGYIVAAVNHHGNTAAEGQLLAQGFLEWERPEDLTAVLNKLLADPVFGRQIDPNRIGAAGHSAGGATVIQIAGGIYNFDAIRDYCNSPQSKGDATCEPRELIRKSVAQLEELRKTDPVVQASFLQQHESHRDPRVKAVFAMAPAIGPAFTPQALRAIDIPVQIVVGDADDVAPMATNAEYFAKLIKGARLTVLPHVGHMTFGSECTPLGKEKLDGCRDGAGVDRAAIHREVEEQVLAFFGSVWAQE
ncbi:MAG TPA: alpha/beta fold hydrolase [Acidobacteriaceae bacterium]|jgi:predicted dienelactone hydrolase|nr:alpha/beta fold hydrolase [Acidobacteriaceae bacterium]